MRRFVCVGIGGEGEEGSRFAVEEAFAEFLALVLATFGTCPAPAE